MGISNSGSVFQFIAPVQWNNARQSTGILFFDILYYILIGGLTLQIIFATIVDTFGQLRDKKSEILSDKETKCFICSIDRGRFQRYAAEATSSILRLQRSTNIFKEHIEKDHLRWAYLYYFVYLKYNQKNLNSFDKDIMQKIINQEFLSFFPMERALVLERDPTFETEQDADKRVEAITKEIIKLTARVNVLNEAKRK